MSKHQSREIYLFDNGELKTNGEKAEQVVLQFLKSRNLLVEDLRHIEEWQRKEVDFRVTDSNEKVHLIEVKSDFWMGKSGNFNFEMSRINHVTTNLKYCINLSWSVFSEADYFMVWSPDMKQIFVFTANDVRRGMQRYTQDARKDMRLEIVETDSARTTINILVPTTYMPYHVWGKNNQGKWVIVGKYTVAKAA